MHDILAAGLALGCALQLGTARTAAAQRMPSTATAVDLLICRHTSISEWECLDAAAASATGSLSDVTSAEVTSTARGGGTSTRAFPKGADAMFFTRGASSNFLLRYYRATSRPKATALSTRLGLTGANAQQQARVAASTDDDACIHTSISEYECFSPDPAARAIPLDSATSRTLTVKLRDGRTITRAFPGNTDAVFLTRGAVSNFLLRYYQQTNKAKATALTKRIDAATPKPSKQ
jgi:hypothetical protein